METLSNEQLAALAHMSRQQEPVLSQREFMQQVTEVMARLLHYQERGEPDPIRMMEHDIQAHFSKVPLEIMERYRNEYKFHCQVMRAVSLVVALARRCPELVE